MNSTEQTAAFLKALGHPLRLQILRLLRLEGRSLAAIAALTRRESVDISYHMTILEAAGLVTKTSQGSARICRLNPLRFRHSKGVTTFSSGTVQVVLPEEGSA